MKFTKRKTEGGFTLVELAIVLVIIGIILAGIIKGQEMINNARIKRAVAAQKEIAAAMLTYQDRYQFLPGDDPNAVARWGAGTANGNGNGLIDGGAAGTDPAPGTMFTCAAATATETCLTWDHLRRAQIISGTGRLNPANPYGGTIGVANIAVSGLTINWIGMSRIPENVCQPIDIQNDDGDATTGTIRNLAAFTSPVTDTSRSQFFRF